MTVAKSVAVLGTASDVGKSVIATGLCRLLYRKGLRTAPFKAQNMSNNAGVTPDGLEIGRAQIVQAEAAGAIPHPDMNPILLKPNTDIGSQIILHGRALGNQTAADYFADTQSFRVEALSSLERLRATYQAIVIEGAGSCAEVNLRRNDFVNFDMAHAADAPVFLVADIDRGGVFAQIIGTLDVLPRADRERVAGIVINRFRGDAQLFDDGLTYLRGRCHVPILGLVPWFYHLEIDPEDAIPIPKRKGPKTPLEKDKITIGVIRLPHIANFTDFSALAREPMVDLRYLAKPRDLSDYNLVLLPGSKNVRFDLDWLRRVGWDREILRYYQQSNQHNQHSGQIGGICGGYQMLGERLADPFGIEGAPGESEGLGLLPVNSSLAREKRLALSHGVWLNGGYPLQGYEIHMGRSDTGEGALPLIRIEQGGLEPHNDGARSEDGRVWGTYLHGLFDEPEFLEAFLRQFNPDFELQYRESGFQFRQKQYDLLADHLAQHLDLEPLWTYFDN